jgi:hypothetical protein
MTADETLTSLKRNELVMLLVFAQWTDGTGDAYRRMTAGDRTRAECGLIHRELLRTPYCAGSCRLTQAGVDLLPAAQELWLAMQAMESSRE